MRKTLSVQVWSCRRKVGFDFESVFRCNNVKFRERLLYGQKRCSNITPNPLYRHTNTHISPPRTYPRSRPLSSLAVAYPVSLSLSSGLTLVGIQSRLKPPMSIEDAAGGNVIAETLLKKINAASLIRTGDLSLSLDCTSASGERNSHCTMAAHIKPFRKDMIMKDPRRTT